ncbi:hypothetical protein GH714_029287 [Hevea brasiliensis]|uniref:Uncharacterized protein n=1 Tax=Hevea brasiliensis TaxID=3981 RepID=A0A6A6N818_HEVBR|nr:hypothetical protein GH714_029036 [Hevea brasiliensis]KAF2320633.1 hypothetical protein GH714_029287 [Hevea brasiliensis]
MTTYDTSLDDMGSEATVKKSKEWGKEFSNAVHLEAFEEPCLDNFHPAIDIQHEIPPFPSLVANDNACGNDSETGIVGTTHGLDTREGPRSSSLNSPGALTNENMQDSGSSHHTSPQTEIIRQQICSSLFKDVSQVIKEQQPISPNAAVSNEAPLTASAFAVISSVVQANNLTPSCQLDSHVLMSHLATEDVL